MNPLVRIPFITVILLAPQFLFAGAPLTLEDCFKAALKRSEVIENQQELVFQAETTYDRAWGGILPTVIGSYAILERDGAAHSGPGNTANSSTQQTLKLSADQPLFRGFRDFAALRSTRSFISSQEQARDWAGLQLYRDVAQAFYARLAVQRDLELLDKELNQYQKRIDVVQERINIGRSRVTEVLTLKAARAILKAQRDQVVGQSDVAKEVLAFLTGLDQDVLLDDSTAPPSEEGLLETYQAKMASRPDILAAQNNVEAFKSGVSIARGARLPSADLTGNLYGQRPDRHDNGVWDAELAVTLPIFSGGIISADVETAKSQQRQSELQLSQVQRLATQEIRSLHHSLKADLAQMASLQEAFDASEKNYKAIVRDYDLGLVTNLDVLQALTAYQDTERSLEKIRYLARIDYQRLEASTAGPLGLMKEGMTK